MCWANGSAGLAKYNTLDAYRTATGQETGSIAIEGASILTTAHQLTTTAQTQTTNVPVAVTQTIADLIGVNTGWKGLGAQTPKRTR